jgi:hypothetical protein
MGQMNGSRDTQGGKNLYENEGFPYFVCLLR